jgi:hypothetical protein
MIIGKSAWYWDRQSSSVCNHSSYRDSKHFKVDLGWEKDIEDDVLPNKRIFSFLGNKN